MLASPLRRSLSQPAWHHSSRAGGRRRDSQDGRRYASARDATWLRVATVQPSRSDQPIHAGSVFAAAVAHAIARSLGSNRRFRELQKATGRGNGERPRRPRNRDVKEFGLGLIFSGEVRRVRDHHMVELQPF